MKYKIFFEDLYRPEYNLLGIHYYDVTYTYTYIYTPPRA